MPWVRAKLREQIVYARADERGELVIDGGRVEIRYRPNDGKLYRAAARNLERAEAAILPDETCGQAEAVVNKAGAGAAAGAQGSGEAAGPRRAGRSGRGAPRSAVAARPDALHVYTDGACSGNPGPAGLGVVVVRPAERLEISEYLGEATNNVAELTAVLRALEELEPERAALIHTDSQYTIGVLQRGWKAKANVELVAKLRAELKRHGAAELVYVPGHVGVALNERCDELARAAIAARRSRRTVVPAPSGG